VNLRRSVGRLREAAGQALRLLDRLAATLELLALYLAYGAVSLVWVVLVVVREITRPPPRSQ